MSRMCNPIATSTQHGESSGAHVFKFRTLATSPTGDSVITASRQTFADPSTSLSASSAVVVADDHYDIAISDDDEECGVDNSNDDDNDRTDSASDSPSASLAALHLTTPKRSSAEISEERNKRASDAAEISAEIIQSTPTTMTTTTVATTTTTVASNPLTVMQTPSPSSRLDPLKGVAAVNRRLDKKEQRSLKRKRKAPLIPDNDEDENSSSGVKRSNPSSNGAEMVDNSSFDDFLHSTLTTDQMSSLSEASMRSEQAQQLIPPGATRRQILSDYVEAEAEEALLRDELGDALCLGQIA